ncbi:hypothetical protein CIG75_04730 [Tumebacillus algifaecis]|uniref:Peptidase C51 domain-containing protein n=1 Tax=Tumebacillus algifaecis TaxID=1214604 RepID=A0A223CYM7_9BACL|nr:CHAP domain-containing protein [Tumebacillus algifaecis]ASS74355.1 hypothetical protein CIG75_04730 [Tumebacillus algifaecis]
MCRTLFSLALLILLALAPNTAHEAATTPEAVLAEFPAGSGGPIQPLEAGLYAFHGVETQRGPQCVEYAERYYVNRYPGTFPYHNSGPGAFDIWEGVAAATDVGGWPTHREHFVAYENGSSRPQPEDMLLYDRTRGEGWGHIAIIAEVYPTAVVILEQNSGWDTKRVLPLVENRILDRGVKGVIRLKANDQQESSPQKKEG